MKTIIICLLSSNEVCREEERRRCYAWKNAEERQMNILLLKQNHLHHLREPPLKLNIHCIKTYLPNLAQLPDNNIPTSHSQTTTTRPLPLEALRPGTPHSGVKYLNKNLNIGRETPFCCCLLRRLHAPPPKGELLFDTSTST